MSKDRDGAGIIGVLGKMGLVTIPERNEELQARPAPVPPDAPSATPEALAKLRGDIGLDDPSSAYHVFEGILLALEDAIPDVQLRYKKALQLAEKQAVTADTIVQEFDSLKDRIEQQSGVMSATLEDLTRKKIEPKRQQREDAESALKVKRQEVANLEAELAQIEKIIKAEEASLESIRANFAAAAGTLTAELREKENLFLGTLGIKKK